MEIQLSQSMQAYVDQRVSSGQFADQSDYVRELIRADEAKLQWLCDEIQKGIDSGISPLTGEEIVARALEKARRRCA